MRPCQSFPEAFFPVRFNKDHGLGRFAWSDRDSMSYRTQAVIAPSLPSLSHVVIPIHPLGFVCPGMKSPSMDCQVLSLVVVRGTCRWSMASPVTRHWSRPGFRQRPCFCHDCWRAQALHDTPITCNDLHWLEMTTSWNLCRSDDEVRVENLRKRYVPRKACALQYFGLALSRRAFVLHEWTCCARVTASWASSWDELPISTRCGRTREFLVFSCSQSTDGLVPNSSGCWASISSGTCWAGRDTGTIPGISSNSLARISGLGSTVDGYLRWTDDELMIL